MANHVATKVTFPNVTDEEFKDIVKRFVGKEGVLNFETIDPMPDDIYRGNLGPEEERKYGKKNWWYWRREHWGTKWNAYALGEETASLTDEDEHSLFFYTAWSFAKPVIQKLAELIDRPVVAIWADENFGYNAGRMEFLPGGIVLDEGVEDDSSAAWGLVEELWGVTYEEWKEEINEKE